jgi:hypothetical protein
VRGEGTKVIVVLHLNQESIRITWWRNQIRVHLSWPMCSRPASEEASNLLSPGVSMGPGLIAEVDALARNDQPTCAFQYNHNLLAIVVVNLGWPLQVPSFASTLQCVQGHRQPARMSGVLDLATGKPDVMNFQ